MGNYFEYVMSSFPGSPRLSKGAIEIIDTTGAVTPKFIFFQYNPDSISRTLTPKDSKQGDNNSEPFRLEGAPEETITVDIELDATDKLEFPQQNFVTVLLGISPQLAALETLIYPKVSRIMENELLAESGKMEIIPPVGPLTVFIFGIDRALPVKITQFSITEEAYDNHLNPIRAKVSISMKVLTYSYLQPSTIAYKLYQANHLIKEASATQELESISGFNIGTML